MVSLESGNPGVYGGIFYLLFNLSLETYFYKNFKKETVHHLHLKIFVILMEKVLCHNAHNTNGLEGTKMRKSYGVLCRKIQDKV